MQGALSWALEQPNSSSGYVMFLIERPGVNLSGTWFPHLHSGCHSTAMGVWSCLGQGEREPLCASSTGSAPLVRSTGKRQLLFAQR